MCELSIESLNADGDCWYQPSTEAERLLCQDWRNQHRMTAWKRRWEEYQRNEMTALIWKASGVAALVIGAVGLWWL